MDPNSYSPISLLLIVSKLIEKSVQSQIIQFMNTSKQWNSNNHAYTPKHSTTTTLLEMTESIYMGIDQMAAFDSVIHELLYRKLRLYNFDESIINWIKMYLENRTQYIVVGAHSSVMLPVITGVPQGSVLGPMLYTLFLNEFPDIVNQYETCNDDSHLPSTHLFSRNC